MAEIASRHDFMLKDSITVEYAVEADALHGKERIAGGVVGFKYVAPQYYDAADVLDRWLGSEAHDMWAEAKSHDEFCRNAY